MTERFIKMANQLGHSIEDLQAGKEIHTAISIPDVDALRSLLRNDLPSSTIEGPEDAGELANLYLQSEEDDISEAAILGRVSAFIYDDVPLSDADRLRIQHLFPMELTALSADSKTINSPWTVGNSQSLVVINLGTLNMENGSCIYCIHTPLQFTVDNFVRNGAPPSGTAFDIGILGVTGGTGGTGNAGGTGGSGGSGGVGTCSSPGIAGDAGGRGQTGSIGATGGVGDTGLDGLASLNAYITINQQISGTPGIITVFTKSGAGGTGGTGGTGGAGGTGGPGGAGKTCGCEGTNGGPGGVGGNGTVGGTGGTGGNGVPGGNVIITVPGGQTSKIMPLPALLALPGKGGAGGGGGAKGPAGSGAGGGKRASSGGGGGEGTPGTQGPQGPTGANTGATGTIFVKQG